MHINAHLDVDVAAIETEQAVTVMLEIEAPALPDTTDTTPATTAKRAKTTKTKKGASATKPARTVIVVLDTSGSMAGSRLAYAQEAMVQLVDRLADADNFGLVTFSDEAKVVVAAAPVGGRKRRTIRKAIAALHASGMTDLSSGYLRGIQEARRVATEAGATLILLSDGHANLGNTSAEKLGDVAGSAAKRGVTTSSIGLGVGYDTSILTALAQGGLGNHAFAYESEAAATAVAEEVDGLLNKSIQAASLLITPTDAVTTIKALNEGLPSHGVEEGVMLDLGDFYAGEKRRVTVELGVPAMSTLGLAQVASLALTYVEVSTLEQQTVTIPVHVNVVPADVAQGRIPNATVEEERLILAVQRTKRELERELERGDLTSAHQSIHAAQALMTSDEFAVPEGSERTLREMSWFAESRAMLQTHSSEYMSRRTSADRLRMSRGMGDRTQGGEKVADPEEGRD